MLLNSVAMLYKQSKGIIATILLFNELKSYFYYFRHCFFDSYALCQFIDVGLHHKDGMKSCMQ